jgi:hypothetical protein
LAAFRKRSKHNSGIYGHEQRDTAKLKRDEERLLRTDKAAWAYWQKQAPSYRKGAIWWVVSAKKPETRARRMAKLAECCAEGVWIPPFVWTKKPKA